MLSGEQGNRRIGTRGAAVRYVSRLTIIASLAGLSIVCALGSPLALAAVSRRWDTDWVQLANIGQTYGAASAVFSALAVAGVGAGLIYQARQLRVARIQTVRSRLFELTGRMMDDFPTYGPIAARAFIDSPDPRKDVFAYSMLQYALMGFDAGVLSEADLRGEICTELFAGETGRRVWHRSGSLWMRFQGSRAERRFAQIINDEYTKAVQAGPPQPDPPSPSAKPPGTAPSKQPLTPAVLALTSAVILAGWLAGRRSSPARNATNR